MATRETKADVRRLLIERPSPAQLIRAVRRGFICARAAGIYRLLMAWEWPSASDQAHARFLAAFGRARYRRRLARTRRIIAAILAR